MSFGDVRQNWISPIFAFTTCVGLPAGKDEPVSPVKASHFCVKTSPVLPASSEIAQITPPWASLAWALPLKKQVLAVFEDRSWFRLKSDQATFSPLTT